MKNFVKITFSVPLADADRMRKIIGEAGAGRIGSYEYGSFSVIGIGRGRPLTGSNPAIGHVGKIEAVQEEKIETICKEKDAKRIIEIIKKTHPYEQPIIMVYPVKIY